LQKAVKDIILCCYKTSKNTRKPTRLIILRDGISEGQYNMVIKSELESIKRGYAEGMESIGDQASYLFYSLFDSL
jgi:hypothetical protein